MSRTLPPGCFPIMGKAGINPLREKFYTEKAVEFSTAFLFTILFSTKPARLQLYTRLPILPYLHSVFYIPMGGTHTAGSEADPQIPGS